MTTPERAATQLQDLMDDDRPTALAIVVIKTGCTRGQARRALEDNAWNINAAVTQLQEQIHVST